MCINSICMKRGRQQGLTVTVIAPLLARLPHSSLWPSFPSPCLGAQRLPKTDGKNTGLEVMGPGEDIHQGPLN